MRSGAFRFCGLVCSGLFVFVRLDFPICCVFGVLFCVFDFVMFSQQYLCFLFSFMSDLFCFGFVVAYSNLLCGLGFVVCSKLLGFWC